MRAFDGGPKAGRSDRIVEDVSAGHVVVPDRRIAMGGRIVQ